jgi:subtilisin family serine protease
MIMAHPKRILVKLQPAVALAAAAPRANLRPLFEPPAPAAALGLAAVPAWYLADLPDGGPTPWDAAHARVADQLGIAASDVLFVEPDLAQSYPNLNEKHRGDDRFALGSDCEEEEQNPNGGRAIGPAFGWHLGDGFSQLGSARAAVQFADRRTRIAHIDTGYDHNHAARPEDERILRDLERNFVDGDGEPNSAQDPNRHHLFDNSGHGTGTIGILAGRQVAQNGNAYLGGAPRADILPIRIANSVLLIYTSVFAQGLQYAIQQQCDVVSISMGGLPSAAWNETVNAAYETGICIVAASGDCFGGLPTHHVVYPARYHRTIAACGIMADGRPYYELPVEVIEGNWGPERSMTAALSAYTPNIPWAKFGCTTAIRQNGEGTSASTPQVAAAVALWYEKYKDLLPRDWRRVEAVRHALFTAVAPPDADKQQYLGRGILKANAALAVAPILNLPKTPADSDAFAFLRVLTGLGIADVPPRERMFNLELTQRWLMNPELQEAVPDPEADVSRDALRTFMEAVIGDTGASQTLRKHVASRYPLVFGTAVKGAPPEVVAPLRAACQPRINMPDPPYRRIRTYAVDPSFSTQLETAPINEAVLKVRWEPLHPGPAGEYLKVVDTDAADVTYAPVDLDEPRLLAQDGCKPAEGNPAFHQQMVYAVAMKTIAHFEQALGRPVLWRTAINPQNAFDDSQFVRQLTVQPHALHQANAYYSPQKVGLLFGYFEASAEDPGDHVAGSAVYACLSHDIIAHETTHAILDGMHSRFNEASNPDVLAFHEAFADIIALMQHFTIPEILENEINRTRGHLESESMLGSLAVQFGRAIGGRGALRDAIGKLNDEGVWIRHKPDPAEYQTTLAPHARGALLVAAVFDAFLAIYKTRTADLLRIYTGGTGVLPSGAIHPDLVRRLAGEATKTAGHVLNICIRALDYIPPVDITFGEYLRGLITADSDLVEDDPFGYRVAFVEAFRRRGIYPLDLDTLSVDTLRWQGVDFAKPPRQYRTILEQLRRYADRCFYLHDREALFVATRKARIALHNTLQNIFAATPDFASSLGLDPHLPSFEIHELRRCIRIGPDGQHRPQIIAALTQSRPLHVDGSVEPQMFRGGSTLIVDLTQAAIAYKITKSIASETRQQRTAAFLQDALADPLRALLLMPNRHEPFAALHALADVGSL